ncbi:coA-transferase III family protein [Mycobacterium kansasii]|uniref:CoA-transferase III family protein n=1 Tax=Mycobacterium kansasii TaxID=1768 RepID=A0A1V3X0Q5_MYCKA|nr:coA-transferase III family protein [Mycobacterium kansasii]
MLESVLAVLTFQAQNYLSNGTVPERVGNSHPVLAPCGVFQTADHAINIAAGTQAHFERLCGLVGREDLINDPRFCDSPSRLRHREELDAVIAGALATADSGHWVRLLREAGIPTGPVHDMAACLPTRRCTRSTPSTASTTPASAPCTSSVAPAHRRPAVLRAAGAAPTRRTQPRDPARIRSVRERDRRSGRRRCAAHAQRAGRGHPMSEVPWKIDGPLATVTVSRPKKRNALTAAMWTAIAELVPELADTDGVRLIALRGPAATSPRGRPRRRAGSHH